MKLIRYIENIFIGIWHLLEGMYITMLNFVRPKLTEQYPENRGRQEYFERFRALLTMPHDENNHHKCTACGICMNNCPNGTITVISKTVDDPTSGKPKKVLDKHLYDLGSCTFCALCTQTCPFGAIEFTNLFEHSVFTKERLVTQLNRPGSSLALKPAAAPVSAATTPTSTQAAAPTVVDKPANASTEQVAAVPASPSTDNPAASSPKPTTPLNNQTA